MRYFAMGGHHTSHTKKPTRGKQWTPNKARTRTLSYSNFYPMRNAQSTTLTCVAFLSAFCLLICSLTSVEGWHCRSFVAS
eukprot:scaffold26941_cov49-Cyclotella_meneghiniana.AAC.7